MMAYIRFDHNFLFFEFKVRSTRLASFHIYALGRTIFQLQFTLPITARQTKLLDLLHPNQRIQAKLE